MNQKNSIKYILCICYLSTDWHNHPIYIEIINIWYNCTKKTLYIELLFLSFLFRYFKSIFVEVTRFGTSRSLLPLHVTCWMPLPFLEFGRWNIVKPWQNCTVVNKGDDDPLLHAPHAVLRILTLSRQSHWALKPACQFCRNESVHASSRIKMMFDRILYAY